MNDSSSFTGRARRRVTSPAVKLKDRLARTIITVGGIGTILAVLCVAVFLVWVVLPLFLPASIDDLRTYPRDWAEVPAHISLDEYGRLGWVLFPSGTLETFRVDDGSVQQSTSLFEPGTMRSWSFATDGHAAIFGLADGSIESVDVGFATEVLRVEGLDKAVADQLASADEGTVIVAGDALYERIPGGQVRRQRLDIQRSERIEVGAGPVVAVTRGITPTGIRVAAFVDAAPAPATRATLATDDTSDESAASGEDTGATWPLTPRLVIVSGEEESNFLTGETSLTMGEPVDVPFEFISPGPPDWLGLSAASSDLYATWRDGAALRVALGASTFIAERGRLVSETSRLSAQAFVLGNNTLAWGDDRGNLEAGFQIRITDFDGSGVTGMSQSTEATSLLVRTKQLASTGGEVRAIAASARSRLILAAFDDQSLRLFNVTNESQLARVRLPESAPIEVLAFGPREDVVALATRRELMVGNLDPRYSEASFNALFRPTWYEGYAEPIHSWQSSSGSDDFEPKHSLMPLIFGTLKATLYSMLFGAPLALLAALFTSEFLESRTRSVVKPTIELMASLPSVVLGFLAALVFAPIVERIVPTTLASFIAFPLAFLIGAYIWQVLPPSFTLRFEGFRFSFLFLAVPLGIILASVMGPVAETLFFAGDLKAWLSWDPVLGADRPQFATTIGGWLFLTLPVAAICVWYVVNRVVNLRLREMAIGWTRVRLATFDFLKFLIGLALTLGFALLLALLLDALGFDPRGGYVDTYVQRNALIVGFVMGFAIIPIIYTIAEDALSTVPEHLRSASLGAGATRWQTAVRIVLPTAASGLFSALMVGLGRAVGETMIVLMAAGNTPVMEWNIFEGFRTLSANIAVELPEAVVGGTHYRTLFLAALVLFVMTFIVNTIAEVIRLRFRKRAYQL